MSEPTVEEVQEALNQFVVGVRGAGVSEEINDYLEIIFAAARLWVDAAEPDIDLLHRFMTIRVGGPTADGRVHLNGSLSNDEWGRLQTVLGDNTLIRRADR